jgi:hypothetical protein
MLSFRTPLFGSLLLFAASFSHAQINMGMVGDSLTDDYLGGSASINNNLASYSWGQILGDTRGDDFSFGGYKSVDDGTWDSVRYSGYEYNWATSGGAARDSATVNFNGTLLPATISGTSVLSTQTAGLSTAIANNEVETAFVGIGSNDFFYHTSIILDADGNSEFNPAAIIDQAFIDDMASSILSGVDQLIAAGDASTNGNVDILLALIPGGTAGGSTPEILAGIEAVNDLLLAGANDRGIATVDLFGWTDDPGRVNPDDSVNIGDLIIELESEATMTDLGIDGSGPCNTEDLCALESHAMNYISEDGLHPNTTIQGLIANEILAALNESYGYEVALLTDEEILTVAGVSAVPIPTAAWLFGSALLGLAGIKRKSRGRS